MYYDRRIESASNGLYKELKRAERGKGPYGEDVVVEGLEPVRDLLATGHRARLVAVDPEHAKRWEQSLAGIAGPMDQREGGAEPSDVEGSAGAAASAAASSSASIETVVLMEKDLLRRLSETATSPGVMAWTVWPWETFDSSVSRAPGRYLYLDRVQDPGNVGTLIRAAAAFGLDGVGLSPGSARARHPKVLRASMGSLFRIPVYEDVVSSVVWGDVAPPLLVADAAGEPLPSFTWPKHWILVIGNEGSGPAADLVGHADHVLSIPMPGGVESLNAAMAGSILLYASTAKAQVP